MSTRSNIIVEDGRNRVQLYRHYDGYPGGIGGVLATLEQALPYAWPLPRFEAEDFAAAIVRAWKSQGGDVSFDGSPEAWELIHADVEWVYVIKAKAPDDDRFEPIVQVFNWQKYMGGETDPNKVEPKPVLEMRLSKAIELGKPTHKPL